MRIVIFNVLSFWLVLGGVTYVDAKLTTHVVYGARSYLLGYWVSLLGSLVFVVTLFWVERTTSWKVRTIAPGTVLLAMAAVSLPAFGPEYLHQGIIIWMSEFFVVSTFTSFVHFVLVERPWIADQWLHPLTKIERAKESSQLWRTVFFSVTFGYIALLIPQSTFNWSVTPQIVTDKSEAFLLSGLGIFEMILASMYTLFGLVYETFRKAELAADALLQIREPARRE